MSHQSSSQLVTNTLDDITFNDNATTGLNRLIVSDYQMVGCYSLDYPDVSVVDHIERMVTGGGSEVTLSGNCIAIDVESQTSFFPAVYNEDWLYIFSGMKMGCRLAAAGFVKQDFHKPWLDLARVAREQFGDIIGCGIEEASGRIIGSSNFWQGVVVDYMSRLDRLRSLCVGRNDIYLKAIMEALRSAELVSHEKICEFVEKYESDVVNWSCHEQRIFRNFII